MTISLDSVPQAIKSDRDVTPFIARSVEMHTVNPVVSYYCKIYVLDHILSKKLHVGNKEVEIFTIGLLDDTESIKNSHEDENVQQVLADRQISMNMVFVFAFKLFNGCLEYLSNYDGSNKIQLASKLRATINFMSVLSVFTGDEDGSLDFSKTTGGKCGDKDEFVKFTKDKVRTLKYQLSRLIKDEVPLKGEEEELAKFEAEAPEATEAAPEYVPEDVPQEDIKDNSDEPEFSLPGAPKFDPSSDNEDDDEGGFKLPGAPKFLPDADLSHINKASSIQVISPESKKAHPEPAPPKPVVHRAPAPTHEPITKESLANIIDTTEQISQIQKHAKFAISALNYEDLDTAEAELLKGIELLKIVRKHT